MREQVVIAWLLAQKPWIVPIPGTTKLHRLEENIGAAAAELTSDDLREIESAVSNVAVQGDRYPERLEQLTGRTRTRITEGGASMSTWTNDELDRIAGAEELEIASVRRDGTLRKPVTIWVIRHGDDLYVRSVYGRTSSWFRGAEARHEAHIKAGSVDKDVRLVEPGDLND